MLTIGLTPILLEQLAHDDFKQGFEHYLIDRRERAASDRGEFESRNEAHFAYLAGRWEEFYTNLAEAFSAIGGNIPGAFAELARRGLVEILTSSATHEAVASRSSTI